MSKVLGVIDDSFSVTISTLCQICLMIIFCHDNQDSLSPCGIMFVYCYLLGDVGSMTIRQELAMLPLCDVCSAALYWAVQPSCYQSCEATAVQQILP